MTDSEVKEVTQSGRAMRETTPYSASKRELQALAKKLDADMERAVADCVSRYSLSKSKLTAARNFILVGVAMLIAALVVLSAYIIRSQMEILDARQEIQLMQLELHKRTADQITSRETIELLRLHALQPHGGKDAR